MEESAVAMTAAHAEDMSALDIEREKHKQRAAKFGVEYREPGLRREFRDDARKEKISARRAPFATGFDLFSDEEAAKRTQRAGRFNMPTGGLQWRAPEVPEDEEKRKARAARFGTDYAAPDTTGLMDIDLFEERKEAPAEAARRPEAVHVYGVDLMSTADILEYFADYGPVYVEWLNDSSCNVLFGDAGTARRAIAGLGAPLPADELPEGVNPADPGAIELLWHKGRDFVKAGSTIPLIFRTATQLDVKPAEQGQSRRLWVDTGGGAGGGRTGRQQRQFKAPKSRRGSGGEGPRSAAWAHDDRGGEGELFAPGADAEAAMEEGDGQPGDAPKPRVKGRGRRRFAKRKSEGAAGLDATDAAIVEQRRRLARARPAYVSHAEPPERETVDYGDL